MRKKLLSNNENTSISKGGILYRPGEIPVLTKSQAEQAKLVAKLPQDFPIANWENMTARQQQQTISHSGLNPQAQWALLNTNIPLPVLKEYSQAQNQNESTALAARVAASLVSTTAQVVAAKAQAAVGKPTVSTPLQAIAQQRKYDVWQEEYAPQSHAKAATGAAAAIAPKNTLGAAAAIKPVNRDGQSGDSDGDQGKKESWLERFIRNLQTSQTQQSVANYSALNNIFSRDKNPTQSNGSAIPTNTPLKYNIGLITPTPSPRMTPSPKPTPTPSPTPTPTPSQSEQRAQAAVKQAMAYADANVRYLLGGTNPEEGFDCCNLIEDVTRDTNLKYGQGYLSKSAEDMVKSFKAHPEYGKKVYDYTEDSQIPPLQAGDFVFSANADNLKVNKHVVMATGNGLQVVEASSMENVMRVTYQFNAYKTEKDGIYYRDSGQVVTYIIRPFY